MRITLVLSALGLLAGLMPSCGRVEDLPVVRQKTTVFVSTPDGIREGATVLKASSWVTTGAPFPEANGTRTRVTAEAVPVEVLPGEYIFVLVGAGNLADPRYSRDRNPDKYFGNKNLLYRVLYFDNAEAPQTAHLASPSKQYSIFGQRIAVKRILITNTNERATCKIDRLLPWLRRNEFFHVDPFYKGGPVDSATAEQRLWHYDLARGDDCNG